MTKQVTVIVEGCKYLVEVGDLGERPIKATVNQKTYYVQVPTRVAPTVAVPVDPASGTAAPSTQDMDCLAVSAPMPGDILEINVQPGDSVNPGDLICVLEAMKMKNMIRTSRAGVIATVEVSAGESVEYDAILVTFE